MKTILTIVLAIPVLAQQQTGGVEGVVLDSISQQPVAKASISLNPIGVLPVQGQQSRGNITTTANGAFAFSDLPAGRYQLSVTHRDYPQVPGGGLRKSIDVGAGTPTRVTLELTPGASISGQIVDEDGDPLAGCMVTPRTATNPTQIALPRAPRPTGDDGAYRITNIAAGKYLLMARCTGSVFQPRPLSEGPDPPPAFAYPFQYYPNASDPNSARAVEVYPGVDTPGIDFQFRPAPVTVLRGTLTTGTADWRGRDDLYAQLIQLNIRDSGQNQSIGGRVNPQSGKFEIRRIFPGSYRLDILSGARQNSRPRGGETADVVGATVKIEVGSQPVEISVLLNRPIDIAGSVQVEARNNDAGRNVGGQISVQLQPFQPGMRQGVTTQIADDGSFTLKSVLPGEWRLSVNGPSSFVKAAWFGSEEVSNGPINIGPSSTATLRILLSLNGGTIRGSAPAGNFVFAAPLPVGGARTNITRIADNTGHYAIDGVAPGKYRVVNTPPGPIPEEGGKEITISEGETVNLDFTP